MADKLPESALSRLLIQSLLTFLPALAAAHPGGVDERGCHKDSRNGVRHCHPERAKGFVSTPRFDAQHPPKAGDEGVLYGPFISIVDGDTFKAQIQGAVMTFRLQAVDAPEHDQPYGEKATRELNTMIQARELVLEFFDVDRYGRIVVQAWVRDQNVNREMVQRGAAWFDSEYSRDERLYEEENTARDRKIGLWALPLADRIEPWRWRKEKR